MQDFNSDNAIDANSNIDSSSQMIESPELASQQVRQKLHYWIERLEDFGRRNRLLFFKDTKLSSIVITEPAYVEIFSRLVDHDMPVYAPLPPFTDSKNPFDEPEAKSGDEDKNEHQRKPEEFISNKSNTQLNRALRNLRYKARTIREEQGFNALYMTFGMLRWQEGPTSEFAEAPLILVPVDILQDNAADRFRLKILEEELVVNPTLSAKLAKEFDIILPEISDDISADKITETFHITDDCIATKQGWRLERKVALGIFNFQTLMIIKDLERNSELYEQHSLIRMLSGHMGNLLDAPDNIPSASDLDKTVHPETVFQILDADSSQQEAIEASKRGASFVLQGPPGTGKTQTITNIIAESLAAGKKILFVSQKAVALDHVHKRLASNGLNDFCLEVHSHKKSKIEVIKDLGSALEVEAPLLQSDTSMSKSELQNKRDELNKYVRELHKPRLGIDLSLYQASGKLSKLHAEPDLKFNIDDVRNITPNKVQNQLSIIREMVTYDGLIQQYDTHPWKGFSGDNLGVQAREKMTKKFKETAHTISSLQTQVNDALLQVELSKVGTKQHLEDFLSVIKKYHIRIFNNFYTDIIDRAITQYSSFTRIFSSQYWKDLNALRDIAWTNDKESLEDLRPTLETAQQLRGNSHGSDSHANTPTKFTWEEANSWDMQYKFVEETLEYAQSLFDTDQIPNLIGPKSDMPITSLAEWFDEMSGQTGKISELVNFRDMLNTAHDNGLRDFVHQARKDKIPPSKWENTYRKRLLTLLVDEITRSSRVLEKFRSSTHASSIERFKKLDSELVETAASEIKAKLAASTPEPTWVKSDSAETTILRKELNKQRRIKPLRRLFSEIPNLLLQLKPCLMMSPLTVSQLLEPEQFEFDIAIFDEASQIPPEYAAGTIMRAKQIVIAGDRHQLPPTRFFQTLDTDEFDEEDFEIEDYESILKACDAINLANKMLLWHYRSEDESLIAFSNYEFYENRLLTFPNANSDNTTSGLEFLHVKDGIYRRGKGARNNPIEARRIAQLVLTHFENTPDLSLGVVAFSQSQRHIIELEIERIKRDHPHLYPLFDYNKEEEMFVKNLENVQGDERDVIIFSVGYGKDELGKMSMNFGPINRQGGERRLNVAVTRARRAVKLVASIEPEDIDLSKTQSRGARLLRTYMEVARDGTTALYKHETVDTEAEFDSPFEESVYHALSDRGVQLHKQVGVSNYRIDLAAVDPDRPGRFLLGIECDGRTYHSAPTARDRDRLRQQLLEDKFGWRIHRIWSTDWINDRSSEIDKVLDAIDKSKKLGPREVKKKLISAPDTLQATLFESKTPSKILTLYPPDAKVYKTRQFEPATRKGAQSFYSTPRDRIVRAINAMVEKNGPIHKEQLKRAIAKRYRVRLGQKISRTLDGIISTTAMTEQIRIKGDFLWPISMTSVPLRIQINSPAQRKIDEIPPEELSLAILKCVKNAVGIPISGLIKETARLFGLRVSTKDVNKIIGEIVLQLLKDGTLRVQDDKIIVGQ